MVSKIRRHRAGIGATRQQHVGAAALALVDGPEQRGAIALVGQFDIDAGCQQGFEYFGSSAEFVGSLS